MAQFPVIDFSIYRSQRSWGKVIFSQASVILLTGGGGSASVHDGIPPPGADTPRTSPPPEQTPLGADTPQSRTPPGPEHAGVYGQRAGGRHPTGMQSCLEIYFINQGKRYSSFDKGLNTTSIKCD